MIPRPTSPNRRARAAGFTLIELLMVLAIAGLLGGIGFVSGRAIVRGQQSRSGLNSLQQSVWQGATAAASRGIRTELVRAGPELRIRNADNGAVLRTFELPDGVSTNLPQGTSLVFTPPGKVDAGTLAALPEPLTVTANGTVYTVTVSLIGEVDLEAVP